MHLLRRSCRFALLTAFFAALSAMHVQAQAVPSAFGPGHSLWVGAQLSDVSASFPYQSGRRIQGVGVVADFHVNYRLSLAAEANFLTRGGFDGSTETSYLAGPKAFIFARGRFRPYGKFLVGLAHIHYPFAIGDASYLALAPGAGTEYRVSRRWMLHAEYEYQMWQGSPGYNNEPDHKLTPNGFHVGVAYRIFR